MSGDDRWRSRSRVLDPAATPPPIRDREAARDRAKAMAEIILKRAEPVDLQALLGHESISTTPMDTHVGQERME